MLIISSIVEDENVDSYIDPVIIIFVDPKPQNFVTRVLAHLTILFASSQVSHMRPTDECKQL